MTDGRSGEWRVTSGEFQNRKNTHTAGSFRRVEEKVASDG